MRDHSKPCDSCDLMPDSQEGCKCFLLRKALNRPEPCFICSKLDARMLLVEDILGVAARSNSMPRCGCCVLHSRIERCQIHHLQPALCCAAFCPPCIWLVSTPTEHKHCKKQGDQNSAFDSSIATHTFSTQHCLTRSPSPPVSIWFQNFACCKQPGNSYLMPAQ